jgi:hypothetical protein
VYGRRGITMTNVVHDLKIGNSYADAHPGEWSKSRLGTHCRLNRIFRGEQFLGKVSMNTDHRGDSLPGRNLVSVAALS